MTSPKSVSWSALVNVGNNESIALTVSGEAANPDEARDIFAFACGQLLGVANSADETTAPLIRAYVSRLVQTEEARPVVAGEPTPAAKKAPWEPKITKSSYDARQANAAANRGAAPAPRPSAEEQAAAAVAQVVKPPAAAKASEAFGLCEKCGEAVPPQQAKLSQLFMSKTLCKTCMEAP